jgi:hypothetical protein
MGKRKCKVIVWVLVAMTVVFGGVAQAQIFESISTSTFTAVPYGDIDNVSIMKISWTALTDGSYLKTLPATKGWLYRMVTNPGSPAPTANYDIYLRDANGVDILGGAGENRHTTDSEQAFPLHYNGSTIATSGAVVWEPVFFENPIGFSLSGNAQAGALGETFLYILKKK